MTIDQLIAALTLAKESGVPGDGIAWIDDQEDCVLHYQYGVWIERDGVALKPSMKDGTVINETKAPETSDGYAYP